MKKILAVAFALAFSLLCFAGCSGKNEPAPASSDEPTPVVTISAQDKFNTVASETDIDVGGEWNSIGDDYMAWLGFDGSEYTDYAGAFKSGAVDVVILVVPAEGKTEDVKALLQKQLDTLIGQNENYPGVNKDKVDAGQIIETEDGFVALCIYGDDAVVESDGAETALAPLINAVKAVG